MSNTSHNMLKEIFQQPKSIINTLHDNKKKIETLIGGLPSIERIYLIGSGTSYHASLVGQLLFSKLTRIPTTAIPSSEFTSWTPTHFDEGTLLIAVSQSGESIDILGAAEKGKSRGALLLTVTNNANSSLVRMANYPLITRAGEEKAVTATKSYTTQLTIIYLLALKLATQRIENKEMLENVRSSLYKLPSILNRQISKLNREASELANRFKYLKIFFLLGSDLNYPTALEGALKLKEACNLYAEGFATREFLHGPVQLVNDATGIFLLASYERDQRIINLSKEFKNYGAPVIAIKDFDNKFSSGAADWRINSQNNWLITPLMYAIPIQLFAYYSSIYRGLNPDKPEKLSKVVEK